ncbi:hypothetical protein [Pseudomonas turukhanskensis]|uniref:hypothetical protein n=1 Tax=Pseudomonas turukhanskensis TaxID=1806536 RepID=UPI0022F2BB8D|nr:hypothetical protein [Pseudomonas turukhanskensis]
MIIRYPSKDFVRTGKSLANRRQSFSVEFIGTKDLKRFSKVKDVFLGEEDFVLATAHPFFMMGPFFLVHFYALASGASAHHEGNVAHYKF